MFRHDILRECAHALCAECRKGKRLVEHGGGEGRFFHGDAGEFHLCNAYLIWGLPDSGAPVNVVEIRRKEGA